MNLEQSREWFVAAVKPHHEGAVAMALEVRGIERFAPTYQIARTDVRADRKVIRPPLFPGYVFCRFTRLERATVLKAPGVKSIIGFGGVPAAVPDEEIDRVRTMVASGRGVSPWPHVETGRRIRVERGPLKGVEGVVLRVKDDWRLVVGVTLLRRSVSVLIEREVVAPSWN